MIKVLIADDHQLFLDGLSALINSIENITVVGKALTGIEALEILKKNSVDIVLMDINMPELNGIDTLKEIKKQELKVPVIMLTMHDGREVIQEVLQAGARGYLYKNSGKKELTEAIEKVNSGGNYFVDGVKDVLIDTFRSPKVVNEVKLTPREKEVLKLICDELTTQEIADKLFLSANTIESHRKNLLSKTGCKNSIGLVKFALNNHL